MFLKAVGAAGSVFILSTLSTSSIEEVAAAAPDTIKWFQLYIYNDRYNIHVFIRGKYPQTAENR
jgi:isopentenyl diphosphate isomerase/L-lactate dehydrogenase-like FMN-dependent dehydrogenase